MEPVAYDELLDSNNSVTGPGPDGASGTGPRPHAQVHLLSPTDKCKVENLEMINSSFDKASVLFMINSHTTHPMLMTDLVYELHYPDPIKITFS